MDEFRVICAAWQPCPKSAAASHISSVGTGEWPIYRRLWTLLEVLQATSHGARFYVQAEDWPESVDLECVLCPDCREVHTLATKSGARARFDVSHIPDCR